MIGKRFSHYEIIREIGGGGMGVVYLARDNHLGCEVAVKVLPPGTLADEAARKRFRREARLLAKRNHPNIVVAHDFDTEGGVDFLVMEFVPGVTLRERLLAGPLLEPEILDLGEQLLRAIAAAHDADVIHQDLKPSNLKITPDGVLKVLDFGLARHHPSVDETTTNAAITETGAIAGTLPYMAPEQLLGKPADRRSDLYSVGVILYEMATGRLPHEGGVPAALIGEILHRDPPPPSSRNPAISAGLEASILRALEKGPDLRFQSARDFERDLKKTPTTALPRWHIPWGWTIPVAAISIVSVLLALESGWLRRPWGMGTRGVTESIAVLPLLNLSNDAEQDYFADGMTEELITKLTQIRDLNVISRTSVMQFKGKKTPLPEIARLLHVRTVLNGSVERVGSRVRIQAQLVDAVHDHHLWAESYVGNLSDILGLQTEVARAISNEVRVKLSPGEEARLAQVRPVDPAAHEAYLRGLYLWNGREPRDLERAIEQYKKAAALDPGYALPHVGLADAYDFLGNYSRIPQSIAHEKAKEEALRALAIDSTLGEAHASLAELKTEYEWDWVEAEREFRRAIELNPGYATAHQWYAEYLSRMGRHQEALAQIERALALDPLSPPVNGMLATVYFHGRQTDKAIGLYRVALDMRPDVLTRLYLGLAYLEKRMYPRAIAEIEQAVAGSGGVPLPKAILGCAYGMAGRRTEARKILARLEAQAGEATVPPSCMAFVWIGLGNKDQAFHWLEKAYAAHDSYLGHLKVAPIVDGLRSDPRFTDLLRRVGLESPGRAS